MPIDKGTSKPITQLSGLQINYKDENSCFNPPIVTTAEREALVNTDDPKQPIKDGTLVFNSDTGYQEYYSSKAGKWIQIKEGGDGTGDVTGPENAVNGNLVAFDGISGKVIKDSGISTGLVVSASSASVRKDQIPVWYSTTAGKISIANSGVAVAEIKKQNTRKNVNEPELYQLSNLGALQFGSNDNVADTGVILVDGLTPVTFQTQGTGADSRVCTVINGELGEGSSSPSALLEINSTEGGLLHARMTTAQRDALLDPKDGLEIYNTDTKNLNIRQNGTWVENTGNNVFRNVKTLVSSKAGNVPIKQLFNDADIAKVTLIGPGGNGGKCVGGYKGCGGGSGGRMVIYLKNLSLLEDTQYCTGWSNNDTYLTLRTKGSIPQVTFTAYCGGNGADGSSSVICGGTAGAINVSQVGASYKADNYSYWGVFGVEGGVATNSGVSGYGGGGTSGVVGDNPGRNATKGIDPGTQTGTGANGGGGSGASGEGMNGGEGGYGAIIIEY